MSGIGTDILFVLPRPVSTPFSTHVTLVSPRAGSPLASPTTEFRLDEFENVTFRTVDAQLVDPYERPGERTAVPGRAQGHVPPAAMQQTVADRSRTQQVTEAAGAPGQGATAAAAAGKAGQAQAQPASGTHYSGDLFGEVQRYAALAAEIARNESFDVIHAHDWMTYPAGLAVAGITGKPLVVHVHSTEFDRSGTNVDTRIYDIERRGMHGAIKVICVSHLTKTICQQQYGVAPEKLEVVYNAIEANGNGQYDERYNIHKDEKIVLFLGRITMQKGPEYFLAAAKKVLEVMDNVKFVMAGSGDMIRRTIEMAASMGIGHKVLFTGFLRGNDVEKVFKMADLYVMPSVSEPFGIAPLEAMSHDVPVLMSKQSGVSEVVQHALKVDFWDVNEMANKIVAVLKHPPLASTLRQHGSFEIKRMSWGDAAKRCVEVYQQALTLMPR
jgi:glycosyltransferase involved in cell wall biosynthesis